MNSKYYKVLPLIAWWLLAAKLLTIPSNGGCGLCEVPYLDKATHFALFFMLAWLMVDFFKKEFSSSWRLIIFFSFSFCFISAYFFEYLQQFVPGRIPDARDLLVGTFGIIGSLLAHYLALNKKPKILLHICCAGCGVYVAQKLSADFDVTLYFYNPNLYPEEEYFKRLEEAERIARRLNLNIIEGKYRHKAWLNLIKGLENCPEKGSRCIVCYTDRLEETARLASKKHFDYFASTLTVSPHKNAESILRVGNELAAKYAIKFWKEDFKKQGGYEKSVILSKELGLYRQNYCGCEFSRHIEKKLTI
jgi:predicted adenine nucleotide alpha hydrolase (AANH) superfamily ATPase